MARTCSGTLVEVYGITLCAHTARTLSILTSIHQRTVTSSSNVNINKGSSMSAAGNSGVNELQSDAASAPRERMDIVPQKQCIWPTVCCSSPKLNGFLQVRPLITRIGTLLPIVYACKRRAFVYCIFRASNHTDVNELLLYFGVSFDTRRFSKRENAEPLITPTHYKTLGKSPFFQHHFSKQTEFPLSNVPFFREQEKSATVSRYKTLR